MVTIFDAMSRAFSDHEFILKIQKLMYNFIIIYAKLRTCAHYLRQRGSILIILGNRSAKHYFPKN